MGVRRRVAPASGFAPRFGWDELYRLVLLRKEERPRGSGTTELFAGGRTGIARRFGSSAVDTLIAAAEGEPSVFIGEVADLVYHLTVLMAAVGVSPAQLEELLRERHELWEKRKSREAAKVSERSREAAKVSERSREAAKSSERSREAAKVSERSREAAKSSAKVSGRSREAAKSSGKPRGAAQGRRKGETASSKAGANAPSTKPAGSSSAPKRGTSRKPSRRPPAAPLPKR